MCQKRRKQFFCVQPELPPEEWPGKDAPQGLAGVGDEGERDEGQVQAAGGHLWEENDLLLDPDGRHRGAHVCMWGPGPTPGSMMPWADSWLPCVIAQDAKQDQQRENVQKGGSPQETRHQFARISSWYGHAGRTQFPNKL